MTSASHDAEMATLLSRTDVDGSSRCELDVEVGTVVATLACELVQQVLDLGQLPVQRHAQSSAGGRRG